MNCAMQTKVADFSKLPLLLNATNDQLKHMKTENCDWISLVDEKVLALEKEHGIEIKYTFGSHRSTSIRTIAEYHARVAVPYIDTLLENINQRFSEDALSVITAMSIFNPALLPSSEDPLLSSYGNEEIKLLANFYGKEACVEHNGTCFTSPPILNADELITEWTLFRRAMIIEKNSLLCLKNLESAASLQELLKEMNTSSTYSGIFS